MKISQLDDLNKKLNKKIISVSNIINTIQIIKKWTEKKYRLDDLFSIPDSNQDILFLMNICFSLTKKLIKMMLRAKIKQKNKIKICENISFKILINKLN